MSASATTAASHMEKSTEEITTKPDSESANEGTPLLARRQSSISGTVVITLLCLLFSVGLVLGIYLILIEEGELEALPGKLNLIQRQTWGANETNATNTQSIVLPARRLLLFQNNGSNCYDEYECSRAMYNLQLHYMKDLNKSDIMANFMVGGDGRTYEGCGWNCKSNYATDNETLTIGLFGIFQERPPTELQVDQLVVLADYAVAEMMIAPCYSVSVFLEQDSEFNFLVSMAELLRKHAICF